MSSNILGPIFRLRFILHVIHGALFWYVTKVVRYIKCMLHNIFHPSRCFLCSPLFLGPSGTYWKVAARLMLHHAAAKNCRTAGWPLQPGRPVWCWLRGVETVTASITVTETWRLQWPRRRRSPGRPRQGATGSARHWQSDSHGDLPVSHEALAPAC